MSHYRKHHPKRNHPSDPGTGNQVAQDAVTGSAAESAEQELLLSLFRELFQEEQSAKLHPRREADRLGDVPPATALRAVAAHAEGVMQELPGVADKNALPVSSSALLLGAFLSNCRQLVIDRLVEPERSYRGTLVGMRHGVDLVELIRHVAQVQGNSELAEWCARWLSERTPLVETVAKELAWFAQAPEVATSQPAVIKLLARLKWLLPGRQRPSAGAATAQSSQSAG